jgi:hypothetical protein
MNEYQAPAKIVWALTFSSISKEHLNENVDNLKSFLLFLFSLTQRYKLECLTYFEKTSF